MLKQVLVLAALLACCNSVLGLYFHIAETERKCFIEEIPDETTVIVNYKVELYDPRSNGFMPSSPGIGMHVEVRDSDDKIILSRVYSSEGRISFTSHTPGEHVICMYSNSTQKAQDLQKELGSGSPITQTYLDIVELLWETNFLSLIMPVLKEMERMCIKKRNLAWKKVITSILNTMLTVMKKLKLDMIDLKNCSFEEFKKEALNVELSMIFTKTMDTELMNLIIENYTKSTEAASSSSANTMTISTSFMTATTPITPVSVPASTPLNPSDQSGLDFLDTLLPLTSTLSNTGSIQQSIFRKKGDNCVTWTSPGETGWQVIKLDIYNYKKICSQPKKNWWKDAEFRSTFLTTSPVDPKNILIQKLVSEVAKQVTTIPEVKKEEKVTGSLNFYGNTQYRQ